MDVDAPLGVAAPSTDADVPGAPMAGVVASEPEPGAAPLAPVDMDIAEPTGDERASALRQRPYGYCAKRINPDAIRPEVKAAILGGAQPFPRSYALAVGATFASSTSPFDFERNFCAISKRPVNGTGDAGGEGDSVDAADGLIGLEEGAMVGLYRTEEDEPHFWVVALVVPPPRSFLDYLKRATSPDQTHKDWYAVLATSAAYITTLFASSLGLLQADWIVHPEACVDNDFDALVVSSAPRISASGSIDGTNAVEGNAPVPVIGGNPVTGVRVRAAGQPGARLPLFWLHTPVKEAALGRVTLNSENLYAIEAPGAYRSVDARAPWRSEDSVAEADTEPIVGYVKTTLVLGFRGA